MLSPRFSPAERDINRTDAGDRRHTPLPIHLKASTLRHILKSSFATVCLMTAMALAPGLATAQAKAPTPAATSDAKMPPMFIENTSPADLPKTIEAFKAEASAAGWSVPTEHNMAGILSARGYTLHPVIVIEVCSGKYSAQLLAKDETRHVASMLPCRVAVYQTSAGNVIISRMNTAMFASMMSGEIAQVIKASGVEMEAIIAKTLAKLCWRLNCSAA